MAATAKRCDEKPLRNLRGNKLTFGRDNLPLSQEVSTIGEFDPKPSVYSLCVYKT